MRTWLLLSLLTVPLALASAIEDQVSLELGRRAMTSIVAASGPADVSPAEWQESDALYSNEGLDALLREARETLTKQELAYGFFVVEQRRGGDFSFDPATGSIAGVSAKPSDVTPCRIEIQREKGGRVRGIRVSIGLVALGFEVGPSDELWFLGAYRQAAL